MINKDVSFISFYKVHIILKKLIFSYDSIPSKKEIKCLFECKDSSSSSFMNPLVLSVQEFDEEF